EVGLVVEAGGLLHPGQVGTGGEVFAASAQQQEAQRTIRRHRVEGEDQLADHLGVEGVVLLGAVQPQGGETARVLFQLYGGEVGHKSSYGFRPQASGGKRFACGL